MRDGALVGAGSEDRTHIASLEGWSFTIKLCPQRLILLRVPPELVISLLDRTA
jgi:hypothetical protein